MAASGFLDEPLHAAYVSCRQWLTGFDVAIAGFRGFRHDAKGDELAGLGMGNAPLYRPLESFHIGDHMIGGQHQEHRVFALGQRM